MKEISMRTKRTLYPCQPGTKKWTKKYGNKLVCVRYRYDEQNSQKMITVELVEETHEWQKNEKYIPKNKIVPVKIEYGEINLRIKVKSLGGKWNKQNRVWELPFEVAKGLGLEERIVKSEDMYSKPGKKG